MIFILIYISTASVLLPLGFVFFNVQWKTFNPVLKVFFTYLIFSGVTDFTGTTISFWRINTTILFQAFTTFQSVFLLGMYFLYFKHQFIRMILVGFIILSFATGYFEVQAYLKEGTYMYWPTLAYNLPLIGLPIYVFYRFFVDMTIMKLTDDALFWVNSTIFFYFSTTLFCFIFKGLTRTHSVEFGMPIFIITLLSNIAFNILSTIAAAKWRKAHREK